MKTTQMMALLAAFTLAMSFGPILVRAESPPVSISNPAPVLDLAQSLEAYKKATMSNDVEGILSYIYPAVFNLVPRDRLKAIMSEMFASDQKANITALEFQDVGAVQNFSKGRFSLVKYQMELQLPHPGDATPDMDKGMIEVLKSKMGRKTKITIDEKRGLVLIVKPSVLLAIKEGQTGWKVLEKENSAMIIKAGLLAEDLLPHLQ